MSFEKFLDANNLPHIGEVVITPKGDEVEVIKYVFDAVDECVKVRLLTAFDAVVEWSFGRIKQCKRKEK